MVSRAEFEQFLDLEKFFPNTEVFKFDRWGRWTSSWKEYRCQIETRSSVKILENLLIWVWVFSVVFVCRPWSCHSLRCQLINYLPLCHFGCSSAKIVVLKDILIIVGDILLHFESHDASSRTRRGNRRKLHGYYGILAKWVQGEPNHVRALDISYHLGSAHKTWIQLEPQFLPKY